MNENDFLKSFAALLGPSATEALQKQIEAKNKERQLLETFSASLSKVANFNLSVDDEPEQKSHIVLPSTPVVEPPVEIEPQLIAEQEVVATEPVVEQVAEPEEVVTEEITIPAEVPVDDLITKAVVDISKQKTQKGVQAAVDKIPDSLRKEIEILKKSILDLHSFAKRQSQMGGGGEVKLARLDDVNYSTAADGLYLKYDQTSNMFVFDAPAGGGGGGNGYTGSFGLTGYTGSIGYFGSRGTTGYTGSIGAIGATGPVGPQGDLGYVGSIGANGFTGSNGLNGYTGSIGLPGYSGSNGVLGYGGSVGYTGSQGIDGYVGSTGNQGYTGSVGLIGFTGSFGNTGYVGSIGSLGYTGSIGYSGSAGSNYLANLNDVYIPGVSNGQILTYSSSLGKWINLGVTVAANISSTGYYGAFIYNGANVNIANTSNAYIVPINGTTGTNGITIGGNNDIVFSVGGTYNIQYSIQYVNTGTSADDTDVWIRKNGVDIDDTNSIFTIPARKSSNDYGKLIAITPILVTANQGDRFQIMTAAQSPNIYISTIPGHSPSVPEAPGTIVIVEQVSQIINGANGYTGSAGVGYAGSIGSLGYSGSRGYTGSIGIGYVGSIGSAGYLGSYGYSGSIGYTGSIGPMPSLTYVTRTATGNSSTVNYTVSAGCTVDNVLVFLDGVCQTPTTDYTITSTTLTFTTAPYTGAKIVIRELPH